MRVTIEATYQRDDGVTVSRRVVVERSIYPKTQTVTSFKNHARRRALEAVNAVLGSPKGLTVTEDSE